MSADALADTSLFIGRESGRPLKPYEAVGRVAVSMITIAELELGVLAANDPATRATRLLTLREAELLEPLPVNRAVAAAFARLVAEMRAKGLSGLGVQDAWVAATAIAHDAELLTQDADFGNVPGLRVVEL